MSWSGWASIAVLLLLNVILISKAWGYLQNQVRTIEERVGKLEVHIDNMDMHWTKRERDALVKELEDLAKNTKRVEELIMESLTERANIVKAITALMERGNNKPGKA